MRSLLAPCLATLALGCGHHTAATISNTPTGTERAPVVSLDDDLAILTTMAAPDATPTTWPAHTTVLGWTADHRLAYRALVCDPDALGGRGPYCELNLCTIATGVTEPTCEAAASFELSTETSFDRKATTDATATWLAGLGPLAAGTPQGDDAATLTVKAHALFATLPGGPELRVYGPNVEYDDPTDDLGVTVVSSRTILDSPDGTCRGAAGILQFRGDYEGVRGLIPMAFGVVRCSLAVR